MVAVNPTVFETFQASLSASEDFTPNMADTYKEWTDFSVLGGSVGVANRQASRGQLNEQRLEAIQAEKDKDIQDVGMDMAVAEMEKMQEQRLERINGDTFRYGEYEFDLDSLKEAVNDNMENWDEFSKNMTAEEKAEYKELSILLMDTNDTEEVERILKRMDTIAGEETKQTLQGAEQRSQEKTVENEATAIASDEVEAQADDLFADIIDKPSTLVVETQSPESVTQTVTPTPVVVAPAPGGVG